MKIILEKISIKVTKIECQAEHRDTLKSLELSTFNVI